MRIQILVDGLPAGELEAENVWRDLLIYTAAKWESEARKKTLMTLLKPKPASALRLIAP